MSNYIADFAEEFESVVTIIKVEIDYVTNDPFGLVRGGTLHIQGQLKRVLYDGGGMILKFDVASSQKEVSSPDVQPVHADEMLFSPDHRGTPASFQDNACFFLPMAVISLEDRILSAGFYGLILQPHDTENKTFR